MKKSQAITAGYSSKKSDNIYRAVKSGVTSSLHLAIFCENLSSSTNLFHENKSTPSREHRIGHDRSCCCDLQDDAYDRNDVWREAFVIVKVRYIQAAIRILANIIAGSVR